ncbi:MAG: POTRA domain-containing protein [Bacteroidaceae bacterium]|nr:POTRA domain-containing protein [Bacteroidaceae bacterium]
MNSRYIKKIHHWLAVAAIMLACLPVAAQNEEPAPTEQFAYTNKAAKYVLGGINIDGIAGYDEEFLLNISNLVIGNVYEVPGVEISEAIRNYWRRGLCSNVEVWSDSIIGNTIYLHFRLTSQPQISSITYTGVKKSEREDIEARLGNLHVGNQITPDIVDRAERIIKRYFEEKGFKNASVDIVQREDVTANNKVLVDININKSEKIKVHRIYVSGVTPKEAKKLKSAMKKTRENTFKNFLRSKKFIPEKYEEDKGKVIERMNQWGYRDALLLKDSVVNIDDSHVDIYLDLYEGQKYYIRNISWVGNTVYRTEDLDKALKMQKGDVYNQTLLQERLTSDEDAIGNSYYDNGYVFYRLTPVEVNVVGDSVDLEMRIVEGKQATFNRVRITGNDRVYEDVVRRELYTKPGDLFSMESIKRSVRELSNLNQFDPEALARDLNDGIKPDKRNGTVDITYPLTTKGGDQVELSAGWGQTGIVGRIGLKFTNFSMRNLFGRGNRHFGFLPQGDGQTLSISGQSNGDYYQQYSIQFLDPWFGGKRPNQFSVSMYYSKMTDVASGYYNNNYYQNYYNYLYGTGTSNYYNYTNYYDPDKYYQTFGFSVAYGKRLRWPDDHFQFVAELSYTRYMLKSWQYFIISDGNCNNVNLTLSLSRTSIDHPFYPRSGSEFGMSVTLTPPYSLWDGKDYKNLATNYQSANYQKEAQEKYRWIEYHKWKFSLKTYTALTSAVKAPVLMTRTEFGLLGSYNKYNKSPFETYYVGGDGMSGYTSGYATETIGLRGYDNGSLAGNATQNAYAYSRMTLELRYPLMLDQTSIYVLGFLEGGNAWANVKNFNPFDMKRSAGVGVRVLLPMVGLMGIDWAYGFQKRINNVSAGGSQFHFIIGREF